MASTENSKSEIPFWRDERVLKVIVQIVFVVFIFIGLGYLYSNMMSALRSNNQEPNLAFLSQTAGFDIGESLIEYSRTSPYQRAFLVGLLNTIRVAVVGIIFATILGVLVGIAQMSTNFLVSKIAQFYIQLIRNIPLLVFMILLYQGVFLKLPQKADYLTFFGRVLLSNRGLYIPWGVQTDTFSTFLGILGFGAILALIVSLYLNKKGKESGRPALIIFWAPAIVIIVGLIAWIILTPSPLTISYPEYDGRSFVNGYGLSPNFMGLFLALVLYTASFIAEIVRAGIQAVSKGQVEAAKSLGMTNFQTMRLVVFPQAMRIIVPPLTSQYLNLTKNSSLATAIGYPDLFQISTTINMQTGAAVEVFGIVMLVYLTFSLTTSTFMNWYNKKIALVER